MATVSCIGRHPLLFCAHNELMGSKLNWHLLRGGHQSMQYINSGLLSVSSALGLHEDSEL